MTREARMMRCPERVLGWIPWYGETLDGSESALSPEQRGAVEAHAAECAECRAEIEMIGGAPFELDVELPDSNRVFEAITARIEAGEGEAADPATLSPEPGATSSVIPIGRGRTLADADYRKVADWLFDESSEMDAPSESVVPSVEESGRVIEGPWSRSTLFAAAAAILLLSVGGVLGGLGSTMLSNPALSGEAAGEAGAIYELASANAGSATASLQPMMQPMIDVVFVDSVSVSEVSKALRNVGVEIISGPSNLGVYRLQLIEASNVGGAPSDSDAAAIAARLKAQASPLVIFAEPVP